VSGQQLGFEYDDDSALVEERLSRQCRAILGTLVREPATNSQLARISLKYTSRISDLRSKGYDIECYDRDHATGLTWYRLITRGTR
jgi:hypothetical protein